MSARSVVDMYRQATAPVPLNQGPSSFCLSQHQSLARLCLDCGESSRPRHRATSRRHGPPSLQSSRNNVTTLIRPSGSRGNGRQTCARRRFVDRIRWMQSEGHFSEEQVVWWTAAKNLRDSASHPEFQTLTTPIELTGDLRRTAHAINCLFDDALDFNVALARSPLPRLTTRWGQTSSHRPDYSGLFQSSSSPLSSSSVSSKSPSARTMVVSQGRSPSSRGVRRTPTVATPS